MGSGMSWKKCIETLVETAQLGFFTSSRPRLLAIMGQVFLSMELFSVTHGVSKDFQGSEEFPRGAMCVVSLGKEESRATQLQNDSQILAHQSYYAQATM